jgi:hypothetical protein
MVDHGDLVVKECRIGFVAEDPFLEDGLIVDDQAAGRSKAISAGTFEGPARFDFQHVIDAVAVLIDPSADRVARISRYRSVGQPRPSV